MNIFLASLFALLPKRYRRSWLQGAEVPVGGAVVSGLVEVFISMDLLVHHYFNFAHYLLGTMPGEVVNGSVMAEGEVGLMGLGGFVLIGFVLQPLTIVLVYFALEGAARTGTALLNGEIRGILPLWMIAFLQTKAESWREEARMGPRIADQVEKIAPEITDLRIASCRPKTDWNDRVTISYRQLLYEVAGEEAGVAPRPFVYLLRLKPEYKVIRALRYYDPDEVRRKT